MAGLQAVRLLTLCEQATEAKNIATQEVDRTWEDFKYIKTRNESILEETAREEADALKRVRLALSGWRGERRHCKKRGLLTAQKRVEKKKYPLQRISKLRDRLKNEITKAFNRHDRAVLRQEYAKEAERMANILYGGNTTREPFGGSVQEVDALYERITEDTLDLLARARLPEEYHKEGLVKINRDEEGKYHFYFGGTGAPDGLDHAHYVMDPTAGVVSYHRSPKEYFPGKDEYTPLPEYQLAACIAACQ